MVRLKKTDKKIKAVKATLMAVLGLFSLGSLSLVTQAGELKNGSERTLTQLPTTLQTAARRWKVDPEQVTAVVIPLDRVNMKLDEPAGEPTPILAVHADQKISPASTAKLVTTLVALDKLGVNFRWKTDFYADRFPDREGKINTLWIRGGGDPTLVVEDFALEIHRLMGHGVRHIEGNIVVDRSHFSLPKGNPAAFDGRASRPYNLLPDPAVINYRNLSFEMTPVPGKDYAQIVTVPTMAGVTVPRTIALKKKGGCGNWKDAIGYRMEVLKNGDKKVRFTGALPKACGAKNFNIIAFDDNEYIERMFRSLWEKEAEPGRGEWCPAKCPRAT
ncbi:D-alanyl-D-alanine carboxypeptidase/D-alanyl-D-alanine-endopeptidase [gut metagenome]|uniref:D-alanyl-D-alanine carboxypeptidase/D-alanyl-D-alanine-endopeptidase n=1 Tax=gut metagenome TaxID=749906 RepID=J9CU30_9ZZZZ